VGPSILYVRVYEKWKNDGKNTKNYEDFQGRNFITGRFKIKKPDVTDPTERYIMALAER